MPSPRTTAPDGSRQRLGHHLRVFDLTIEDRARLDGLDRVALKPNAISPFLGEFDHLDPVRTEVDTQQGGEAERENPGRVKPMSISQVGSTAGIADTVPGSLRPSSAVALRPSPGRGRSSRYRSGNCLPLSSRVVSAAPSARYTQVPFSGLSQCLLHPVARA